MSDFDYMFLGLKMSRIDMFYFRVNGHASMNNHSLLFALYRFKQSLNIGTYVPKMCYLS